MFDIIQQAQQYLMKADKEEVPYFLSKYKLSLADLDTQLLQDALNRYWDFDEFFDSYMEAKSYIYSLARAHPNAIQDSISYRDLLPVPKELEEYVVEETKAIKEEVRQLKAEGKFHYKSAEKRYRKHLMRRWFEYSKDNIQYRSVIHYHSYFRFMYKHLLSALKVRKPHKRRRT